MKFCIKCGTSLEDDAAFCTLCGANQSQDSNNVQQQMSYVGNEQTTGYLYIGKYKGK